MGGTRRYAAVSLFAGCGGMDLGAEESGRARVVWAVDNEHWAVRTYRRNLGGHIVHADIRELEVPDVPCDILLAGPPCQDFSTLWNHDGAKTDRGNLFREVSRERALRDCHFPDAASVSLLSSYRGATTVEVRPRITRGWDAGGRDSHDRPTGWVSSEKSGGPKIPRGETPGRRLMKEAVCLRARWYAGPFVGAQWTPPPPKPS